jgi:hypothetical protein
MWGCDNYNKRSQDTGSSDWAWGRGSWRVAKVMGRRGCVSQVRAMKCQTQWRLVLRKRSRTVLVSRGGHVSNAV